MRTVRSVPIRVIRVTMVLGVLTLPSLLGAQSSARVAPQGNARDTSSAFDSTRYGALRWRSIGPFRGGRVTAVAGVATQPLVYYMGATGGGVWKTDDAGNTWRNVSDGQFHVGSIGAIAVSPDDPNVVYVGTGEAPPRGQSSSFGDGVYKSTDAGRTWSRVGLENTRSISAVVVHPRNNDVVYVAAQGSRWGPWADRGIFRSSDGGKSWKRILFVNDSTGPSDLSMDPSNPRILYAAFWDFRRFPWQIRSGGPASGIWKSTDGGDTWTKLAGGLPTGVVGKIGVSVSAADPNRVYANIEADSGGLYRSDDAGKTWRRTSDDRAIRARAWYYTNVIADPQVADVVYVMNAPIMKSIDGGRTFTALPATHGDNHALWINPSNHEYMINGNDGGASVTTNGGRTWSSQMNQPTAQFYRVNTDNQFPYWVYGAQQDNTTVATASRSQNGGIDQSDWYEVGGCESAHIAFDPRAPRYIYAGCYQGIITEFDRDTRVTRNVMVWPALGLAEPSNEQKYRFNWSAPITTSPHDRATIYHGGNVLFKSTDRGQTWSPISPDLTRNDKTHQGLGGAPITNEGAGGEVYGTIYYVVESPHEAGTIWVGTDDGLVQLTRDGGRTWTNVTPKGLPESQINAIEVSPHDKGTAYITVYRAKWNDNAPYIFKTNDYGKSWTRITNGFPPDMPVSVVREGPVRRGLLYAGTENGAWVSFDDGAHWQTIQGNLPPVRVTDFQISHGDLVASTEGRAFWILDDLTPFAQGLDTTNATRLFKPRDAYRTVYGPTAEGQPAGANPPPGAIITYWLAAAPDSTGIKLDILASDGRVVRSFSSKPVPSAGPSRGRAGDDRPLAAKKGLNRMSWDLRTPALERIAGLFLASGTSGFRVAPGTYTVRLTANGATYSQPLTVLADPRLQLSSQDLAREQQVIAQLHDRANEVFRSVVQLRDVRDQVGRVVAHADALQNADSVKKAGRALSARIDTLETRLVQPRSRNGQDIINFRNGIVDQILFLAEAVDDADAPVTQGMTERMADLDQQWSQVRAQVRGVLDGDVARFNTLLQGAPAIVVQDARKPVP
jgi:photosystem II stability/assembly factor-like uncharacterized protein